MQNNSMSEEERRAFWVEYWRVAREGAVGKWGSILSSLAPQLGPAIDAKGRRHVPCPVHGGKDGFRMWQGFEETGAGICNSCGSFHDGFALLQFANRWDARTSVEEVSNYLNFGAGKALPRYVPKPEKSAAQKASENESLKKSLNKVWMNTVSIRHRFAEPARRYLVQRGLVGEPPESLRFHPSLGYYDQEKERTIGYFPALIAVITGADGKPGSLHRTYLTPDGYKADVESPRKMMAYPDDRKVLGGGIQLMRHGRVLAVAEGIETTLAVITGSGIPAWATVNATLMEHFVPPPGVEQLIVFVDKDRPTIQHPKGHGQEAGSKLVQRAWAMGVKAAVVTPPGDIPAGAKSLDWEDVLNRDGPRGFPTLDSVRRLMLQAA